MSDCCNELPCGPCRGQGKVASAASRKRVGMKSLYRATSRTRHYCNPKDRLVVCTTRVSISHRPPVRIAVQRRSRQQQERPITSSVAGLPSPRSHRPQFWLLLLYATSFARLRLPPSHPSPYAKRNNRQGGLYSRYLLLRSLAATNSVLTLSIVARAHHGRTSGEPIGAIHRRQRQRSRFLQIWLPSVLLNPSSDGASVSNIRRDRREDHTCYFCMCAPSPSVIQCGDVPRAPAKMKMAQSLRRSQHHITFMRRGR